MAPAPWPVRNAMDYRHSDHAKLDNTFSGEESETGEKQ